MAGLSASTLYPLKYGVGAVSSRKHPGDTPAISSCRQGVRTEMVSHGAFVKFLGCSKPPLCGRGQVDGRNVHFSKSQSHFLGGMKWA